MQLAGPHVFGPPADRDAAVAVLREAVDARHHPHRHQRLLRPARHQRDHPRGPAPVPRRPAHRHQGRRAARRRRAAGRRRSRRTQLRQAGARQPATTSAWTRSTSSTCASAAPTARAGGSIAEPFGVLADLQREGLIRHLGVSTVTAEQVAEAQAIAPVVCVQNLYNLANRERRRADRRAGRAGHRLRAVLPARRVLAAAVRRRSTRSPRGSARTPMAVALAWLLHRSPNILLIPGTSSVAHLRENVAGRRRCPCPTRTCPCSTGWRQPAERAAVMIVVVRPISTSPTSWRVRTSRMAASAASRRAGGRPAIPLKEA